jgi:hypothetical protein
MSNKPSNRVSEGRLPPHEAYAGAYEAQRTIEGQHLSYIPPREAVFHFFDKKIRSVLC